MNARKQILVAILVAVAAPLTAAAATPERTHSPLSHWSALAKLEAATPADARRDDAVSYPLVSYTAQQKSVTRVAEAKDAPAESK